jgi:hypothetical protein
VGSSPPLRGAWNLPGRPCGQSREGHLADRGFSAFLTCSGRASIPQAAAGRFLEVQLPRSDLSTRVSRRATRSKKRRHATELDRYTVTMNAAASAEVRSARTRSVDMASPGRKLGVDTTECGDGPACRGRPLGKLERVENAQSSDRFARVASARASFARSIGDRRVVRCLVTSLASERGGILARGPVGSCRLPRSSRGRKK